MRSRPLIVALLAALGAIAFFWWVSRSHPEANPRATSESATVSPPAPAPAPHAPPPRQAKIAAPIPQLPASQVLGSSWKAERGAEMAEFRDWTERFLAADPETRRTLIPEG